MSPPSHHQGQRGTKSKVPPTLCRGLCTLHSPALWGSGGPRGTTSDRTALPPVTHHRWAGCRQEANTQWGDCCPYPSVGYALSTPRPSFLRRPPRWAHGSPCSDGGPMGRAAGPGLGTKAAGDCLEVGTGGSFLLCSRCVAASCPPAMPENWVLGVHTSLHLCGLLPSSHSTQGTVCPSQRPGLGAQPSTHHCCSPTRGCRHPVMRTGNLRSLGALLPPCSAPPTDVQTIPPNREPSALPAGKPGHGSGLGPACDHAGHSPHPAGRVHCSFPGCSAYLYNDLCTVLKHTVLVLDWLTEAQVFFSKMHV